jgi:hypothetical protein
MFTITSISKIMERLPEELTLHIQSFVSDVELSNDKGECWSLNNEDIPFFFMMKHRITTIFVNTVMIVKPGMRFKYLKSLTGKVKCIGSMDNLFKDSMCPNPIKGDYRICEWDFGEVTSMNFMFENSSFDQNLLSKTRKGEVIYWDTSKVVTSRFMFNCSKYNRPLVVDGRCWDFSANTDISYMFDSSKYNHPLTIQGVHWDISKVVYITNMFASCEYKYSKVCVKV